ncbi:hypothetical protein VTL71DRAFT_6346 [Oculimacula yallundae]|uniref:Uncharacterized protein n=1 Tax=Oculimacula yallundae TaxID=86028 RepID=A0ABR4BWQ4_9HELO
MGSTYAWNFARDVADLTAPYYFRDQADWQAADLDQERLSVRRLGTRLDGEPAKLIIGVRVPRDRTTSLQAVSANEHLARIELSTDQFHFKYKLITPDEKEILVGLTIGELDNVEESLVAFRSTLTKTVLTSDFSWPFTEDNNYSEELNYSKEELNYIKEELYKLVLLYN